MVIRPVAMLLVAGLNSAWLWGQTTNAMLDGTKTASTPPPVALPLESRGDILMARKMYREAIETYSQGSAKDAVLKNKIGIAYHQLMQLNQAQKYYLLALKLNPKYVEAMNNVGTIYYGHKSYRKAIGWYEKALKVDPNTPRAASVYMNMGMAWFGRKQYQKATQDFQTALSLDPNIFEHHGTFGQILEERSVAERAKFHFTVAKMYAKQGRTDLALQYLRKSLEEGYKPEKKKIEDEPEFAALKNNEDFQKLLTLEPRVL